MTNLPFGFSPSGDDDPEGSRPGQGPGPGGFDLSQLGSMLSQLGQMMSQAGAVRRADRAGELRPRPAARHLADPGEPPGVVRRREQGRPRRSRSPRSGWTARRRCPPASGPPRPGRRGSGSTRRCRPGRSSARPSPSRSRRPGSRGCPEQAKEQAGPLLAMMGSMGGMAFGSQLGQGLAQLATEVLTSTDVGLPLGPVGTAALMPRSIAEFGSGLEPAGGPGPAVPGHPRGRAPPAVRAASRGSATGCSR